MSLPLLPSPSSSFAYCYLSLGRRLKRRGHSLCPINRSRGGGGDALFARERTKSENFAIRKFLGCTYRRCIYGGIAKKMRIMRIPNIPARARRFFLSTSSSKDAWCKEGKGERKESCKCIPDPLQTLSFLQTRLIWGFFCERLFRTNVFSPPPTFSRAV